MVRYFTNETNRSEKEWMNVLRLRKMKYIFKKIDLGISGKGLMIFEFSEIQKPIIVLLENDIEKLNKEWDE